MRFSILKGFSPPSRPSSFWLNDCSMPCYKFLTWSATVVLSFCSFYDKIFSKNWLKHWNVFKEFTHSCVSFSILFCAPVLCLNFNHTIGGLADYCLLENGGCDQICYNKCDKKTSCGCYAGYALAYDGKSCLGVLFWNTMLNSNLGNRSRIFAPIMQGAVKLDILLRQSSWYHKDLNDRLKKNWIKRWLIMCLHFSTPASVTTKF